MARQPVVAGQFYPGTRDELIREIERCFLGELGPGALPAAALERKGAILGLVAPHAGYYYSGSAAAHAYAALAADGVPGVAVTLGPNHHGRGAAVAISPDDAWATPLGSLSVDAAVAEDVLRLSRYAQADDLPHAKEHSIEVQLPFLQYIGGASTRILPVSIAHLGSADALELVEDMGQAIAQALAGKSAVVIASTDLSHYESQAGARAQDALFLDKLLAMDPEGLIDVVYSRGISSCGAVGVAVMLKACIELGASSPRRLTYYTSGDVTGDVTQVVGYVAASVEKAP